MMIKLRDRDVILNRIALFFYRRGMTRIGFAISSRAAH